MLPLDIPERIYEVRGSWDGNKKKMKRVPAIHLELEHSLRSIANWESKWRIPFVEAEDMTSEQFTDYIRCMTLNKLKNPEVYQYIRQSDVAKIGNYIHDPMTARKLKAVSSGRRNRAQMTSEYFYFLMIQYGIPFECDKWHFGRLIALIDCCQVNSGDGEQFKSYREKQLFYAELNRQRRSALRSLG